MNSNLPLHWTAEKLLALSRNYQEAAVLAAAADLDLFSPLASAPLGAAELARLLQCNERGLAVLLDALAALQLLEKSGGRYALAPGLEALLTAEGPQSILAMTQHQAHCLRNWAQLALVAKSGWPAQAIPSVRGQTGEQEAFIGGMHNISAPVAGQVIQAVQPLRFKHLLDIGGASGTWTIAFLRACPSARATLFDLPHVIPMARRRLAAAGLSDRVRLVPGDFYADALPPSADLAWVSAIVHQNSRQQNRALFAKVFEALAPGGRIALRDVLMEEGRTRPVAGALFAVNMLVATPDGGTFTFAELRDDLAAAGFVQAAVLRQDEAMNSVVVAVKGLTH
ncbi:MAG: methyltransferase [Limisphaerales bacterium]